jgi:hypothetical protein
LTFCGNEIINWSYGAGVSTGQGTTPDALICNNKIHDSGIGADSDSFYPTGIESWGLRNVILGNTISNVAASGIYIGGPSSTVTGNKIIGSGKRGVGFPNPGIQIGYVNSTYNGNNSIISANVVIDDGTTTTNYGLADTASNTGTIVFGNKFSGNLGPTSISGATVVDGGFNLSSCVGSRCVYLPPAYTVAGLPTCNSAAASSIAYVTDANAPTYNGTLTGSSTTKTLALCNGSAWVAH